MFKKIFALAAIGALPFLGGCENQKEETLSHLNIGVTPNQKAEVEKERYRPLAEYLQRETGMSINIIVPNSYEELITLLAQKKLDIANFGGVTFLKAHFDHGANPLVARDVDTKFRTAYVVRKDSTGNTLEDFSGKTLAFGSELSTSGHLMPRYFMERSGIIPESHFGKIIFTGAHDKTVLAVKDGKADVGAANSLVVDKMLQTETNLRVLEKSPPYIDYVWATRKGLPKKTREKLLYTFLALDITQHEGILSPIGAKAFLPVSITDFNQLIDVMRKKNILKSKGS